LKIKGLLKTLAVCLIICLFVTGCTPFDEDPESLLVAPELSGEMHPVWSALDKKIDGKYQLKFPTAGETKSAITLVDLDNDGLKEGVAFYSTTDNNTVTMHIALIAFVDGKWSVTAQESIVAGGVEQVYFTDMDGDKVKEIIVGWNVYGSTSKTVSLYEYSGKTLITLMEEPFSTFMLCDLDRNLSQDILILYMDMTTSRAFARYFGVTSEGVRELGNCEIDGNITSYGIASISKLPSDEFCVYVDCVKGGGMVTAVILFKGGKLVCPFYDSALMENTVTYRSAMVPSRDYDGDSFIEIPVMVELPLDEKVSTSAAYLTVWSGFDGNALIPRYYTLMNYSDGYSVKLNEKLAKNITALRNLELRERIICEYDYENEKLGDELFRIRVVSRSTFDTGIYNDDYILLSKNDALVWLASVKDTAKKYSVTEKNINEMFELITEE